MANCRHLNAKQTHEYCVDCGAKIVRPPKKHYAVNGYCVGISSRYAINTGIKRQPKKGEYYLSGAIPMAYKAPNDLSTAFLIAEIIMK